MRMQSKEPIVTFLHIPKCAGTTLNNILRSTYGASHCDAQPLHGNGKRTFSGSDFLFTKALHPSLRSMAGHSLHTMDGLLAPENRFRYFTFVREPVRRCMSFYSFKRMMGDEQSMDAIIQWTSNSMNRQLSGSSDFEVTKKLIETHGIFCGVVEHFDESLLLLKQLAIPELCTGYTKLNQTSSAFKRTEEINDEDLIGRIKEANRHDIRLYRYCVDELFPEYRAHYGAGLEKDLAEFDPQQCGFNKRKILANRVWRNLVYKPALRLKRRISKA